MFDDESILAQKLRAIMDKKQNSDDGSASLIHRDAHLKFDIQKLHFEWIIKFMESGRKPQFSEKYL